ncbi:hypothetical protein F442_09798 [Phytophthora nicotianae P10297]|uniref:Uncharacterized protein n=3 Tax=Phytophthora nicotianae TaxID=4792 RepID=W2ZB61_PHYNI|nr:hypothetical protein L917_09520 [Phytophthora nicotianae]ETM45367.1 hypothetical protein L914_09560 [Phytophthora nicotianae]ETO74212.1 hypothetical protein F444_09987 [Phytophthora nicotianae P1976]ETP43449.1 hypothetical protein F442_09798 [Phytophthora nicotianae P10297]
MLTDVRDGDTVEANVEQLESIVSDLERYNIAEEEVTSEDDIRSECSGIEDESYNEDK